MHARTLILLAALALAACSGGTEPVNVEANGDSNSAGEGASEAPGEATPGSAPVNDLRPDVAAARKDLAARLSVAEGEIEFVEHRNVTWSDGAMGCPEPGMMYTQALVPGIWIHFRLQGEDHVYHGSRSGDPFYCPADRAEPPPDGDPLA